MGSITRRTFTLAGLATALLLLLLALGALNAFNIRALHPGSTGALLVFWAVTVLTFLLLLALMVLLARNILKLYADQRSRVLGSRLRSRMLVGALLLSFAPTLFMFLFSYLLMNRSIDRWFSQPVAQLRDDSTRIALQLSHYVAQNARAEAESMAHSRALADGYEAGDASAIAAQMRSHHITLEGGFGIVYRDGKPLATYQFPAPQGPVSIRVWMGVTGSGTAAATSLPSVTPGDPAALSNMILSLAQRSDEPILSMAGNEYALGAAPLTDDGVIVVALPMPNGLSAVVDDIGTGARQYWAVYQQRRTIRGTYLLLLMVLTTLTFFASSWLALYLSKQITRPVEALADAMDEIAAGDYRQRVTFSATEELGDLIASFNQMAADLEQSRALAESSTEQLSTANFAIDARRRELELILETIPSGVVVLDTSRRILQVNRAFLDLCLPESARATSESLAGTLLETLLPADLREEVLRLERRAQRMGLAGAELEMRSVGRGTPGNAPTSGSNQTHSFSGQRGNNSSANAPNGHGADVPMLSLSVTIALLNLGLDASGRSRRGSILVVDDVTEVLQAQRQVAWKEVAQRVAHEIKNPLTPISLSAERIRRHVDRNTPDSPAVIRRCSEVILSSVESMRTLVDQFAALAQFPTAQPRPASLNSIVDTALALFLGRLEGIHIDLRLASALPPVLADPEALKRALANLIDNAAEAMGETHHRVLTIETQTGERPGMVELSISDTGPGLSPEVRERLFLPYVSTKQRGTGLGLVIAAKIIQDHQGTIRAESRTPSGARFLIELPIALPAAEQSGTGADHASAGESKEEQTIQEEGAAR